mmetsp:Transcript_29936/g.81130  ORF Transcript_29936/g.81130 Transcript_29936/m.81130 type:complete len:252 (+) Transcript_29936:281-1036(+)
MSDLAQGDTCSHPDVIVGVVDAREHRRDGMPVTSFRDLSEHLHCPAPHVHIVRLEASNHQVDEAHVTLRGRELAKRLQSSPPHIHRCVAEVVEHQVNGPVRASGGHVTKRGDGRLPDICARVIEVGAKSRKGLLIASLGDLPQSLRRGEPHVVEWTLQALNNRGNRASVVLRPDQAQDLHRGLPHVLRAVLQCRSRNNRTVTTDDPLLSEGLQRLRLLSLAASLQATPSRLKGHHDGDHEDPAASWVVRGQ